MRVLSTVVGSPSHARAQLPLLRSLLTAGHQVRLVCSARLSPVFADDDIPILATFPLPSELFDGRVRYLADIARPRAMAALLGGARLPGAFAVVSAVAREFRPHLIIRDGVDVCGLLVAEELGVPHLSGPSGWSNVLDPAVMLPALNAMREQVGLPTGDDPLALVRFGRVDCVPEEFSFAAHLPTSHRYRQSATVERGPALPAWLGRLRTDRPIVYAAIGTALPMFLEADAGGTGAVPIPGVADPAATLRAIVDGLAEVDCTAVVSTGGVPLGELRPAPHVHLVERVPQPLLLEEADLFVTHGGYNSLRESIRTGTPVAVLPQFGDQPHNARRAVELGLGARVEAPAPDTIADHCRRLLADPDVRRRARRARLASLALPPVESAADDLAELVAGAAG
ncbi:glycosyltransferase [Streptomyces hainanensis]|uniref:Glycosyltransferase n=1 Tax=Streptomyces hainanensis TaxID=402648 RepID=A0A4R4SP70_9ACTN|nr:glycosyltransferase [Streptomyces hainanensis]TDC65647.1 glycosyltransferase [Streptomyces hainanensis]